MSYGIPHVGHIYITDRILVVIHILTLPLVFTSPILSLGRGKYITQSNYHLMDCHPLVDKSLTIYGVKSSATELLHKAALLQDIDY